MFIVLNQSVFYAHTHTINKYLCFFISCKLFIKPLNSCYNLHNVNYVNPFILV